VIVAAHAGALPLADESVQCIVTSPPYWGLRKYAGEQDLTWPPAARGPADPFLCAEEGHLWGETIEENATNHTGKARWQHTRNGRDEEQPPEKRVAWQRTEVAQGAICRRCGTWRGAFGLEPTIEMYVEHTVAILRELGRVLRADGVLFWNLGDSYHNGDKGGYRKGRLGLRSDIQRSNMAGDIVGAPNRNPQAGLKPKDLCLIPARVALAAQAAGWWVRSMIVWAKPNPMPESAMDRPTDAYEHILMLTKSERYFWDADAVREPASRAGEIPGGRRYSSDEVEQAIGGKHTERTLSETPVADGRNIRNVWTFPTQPYEGAHFATFPEEIPRRAILAATSAKGACRQCGAPWRRVVRRTVQFHSGSGRSGKPPAGKNGADYEQAESGEYDIRMGPVIESETIGWRPGCLCRGQRGDTRPCTVLDPFAGSGTTGRVAIELSRAPILCDIAYAGASAEDRAAGRDYRELAERRMRDVQKRFPL